MSAKWQISHDQQNGISEWKCIPEWKFRMEVHSKVEYLRVELNGPGLWASVSRQIIIVKLLSSEYV